MKRYCVDINTNNLMLSILMAFCVNRVKAPAISSDNIKILKFWKMPSTVIVDFKAHKMVT